MPGMTYLKGNTSNMNVLKTSILVCGKLSRRRYFYVPQFKSRVTENTSPSGIAAPVTNLCKSRASGLWSFERVSRKTCAKTFFLSYYFSFFLPRLSTRTTPAILFNSAYGFACDQNNILGPPSRAK